MPKPPRAPTRRRYTPALKADGKRRYEQTDEQASLIAADFGIHPGSFWRLAKREGWVRYVPPPRDISPAAKLQVQAEALEQALHPPLEGEGRTRERSEPRAGWGYSLNAKSSAAKVIRPHPDRLRYARRSTLPTRGRVTPQQVVRKKRASGEISGSAMPAPQRPAPSSLIHRRLSGHIPALWGLGI